MGNKKTVIGNKKGWCWIIALFVIVLGWDTTSLIGSGIRRRYNFIATSGENLIMKEVISHYPVKQR